MEGLSIICAGLGEIEEDDDGVPIGYSKGEYCLDNLKDLLRFMRRDDPQKRDVFKQVCKWKAVRNHLLPIIEYCQDDRNLVLHAVKVLVFLTMPIDPTSNDIPQQIEFLWDIKFSFTISNTVPAILSLLESPLENLASESFTEDDWKLVQLVLTLFRNILSVQHIPTQQNAGVTATQYLSLRDRFLELLFQENVMDLLLVLSQHVGDSHSYLHQDNLLFLEIFYYIFMGQDPGLIAKANSKNLEEDEDIHSLKCIMEEEKEKRKHTRLRSLDCYAQLSGTFTRPALDGSQKLFKGNPYSVNQDSFLKAHKKSRGPSKKILWEHGRLPPTKNKIGELLHRFIEQFLSGGYNVLMQSIRQDIEKECHSIQNSDIIVYFHVAWFVTSFQHNRFMTLEPYIGVDDETLINQLAEDTPFRGGICGPITESLNESMFAMVISKWRFAFDVLKETNDYKLLSAAGSLLKVMISMLYLVLKKSPGDSAESKTARILLYKLFYDQTEEGMTQFVLNMVKSFDTHKQPRSDLGDLVETIHVIFRLMESLQTRGTLRVTKRSRKRKTKKDRTATTGTVTSQNKETGSNTEQSEEAIMVGEKSLADEAFRREEDGQSVMVNELPESEKQTEDLKSSTPEMEKSKPDDLPHETENSSGDEQPAATYEADFKISTLLSALRNQTFIKKLCWLLRFCKTNSPTTNHCILRLLRQVSEYLEHSPLLFRLSILTTFHGILEEQKSSPCKGTETVVLFLTNLVRRMLKKLKSHPLPVVDLLSKKTKKERQDINSEWILKELGDWSKAHGESASTSIDGETPLSGEQGWTRRSIADALGDDEADLFVSHELVGQKDGEPHNSQFGMDLETNEQRSGEGEDFNMHSENDVVVGKEKDSEESHHVDQVSGGFKDAGNSAFLTDELEGKIKDLFLKYNGHENCSQMISEALERGDEKLSPTQVSKILKQLGLKLARKRRTLATGADDSSRYSETASLNMDHPEDSSSLRKPLHTRKRIRAFTEHQDQMIRQLFEQFKDHKKCSLMIANSLDTEGALSAAQVSRRLRKLGLFVSRKKRSDSDFHLRDEDSDDMFVGGLEISDDEPLVALKKRSKSQRNKTKDAGSQKRKTGKEVPLEDSADKFSGSALLDKAENSTTVERPDFLPATLDHVDLAGGEATGKHSSILLDNSSDMQHEQQHKDVGLDDLEDYAAVDPPQKSVSSRRQLRMIMDLDDDE